LRKPFPGAIKLSGTIGAVAPLLLAFVGLQPTNYQPNNQHKRNKFD